MPHIDELLGVATLATAGLLVVIALQPLPGNVSATRADVASQRAAVRIATERPAAHRVSTLLCDTGA